MAFKPKTYSELCAAMQTRATVDIGGVEGVINGIQAEDGSGRNWNVTLNIIEGYSENWAIPIKGKKTVFFREGTH